MKGIQFAAAAVAAVLNSFALAAPSSNSRHVLHERRVESSQWINRGGAASTMRLPMRIGLTQSNLIEGHDMLMDVSDPHSANYGRYYTAEEVHELFAPSEESVAAVRAWIEEAGIEAHRISQSTNKQWLQFDALTEEVERLLMTRFHIYEHNVTGKTSIGCDEYHVKDDIRHHIDYVTPGTKLMEFMEPPHSKFSRRTNFRPGSPIKTPLPTGVDLGAGANSLEFCNSIITPNCIMAMYNITNGTSALKGNKLGIFEETPEWLDQSDMDLFFSHVVPYIPNGTFPKINEIDGAANVNSPSDGANEAILDFQISYPIIWPQNSVMFLTDDNYAESGDYVKPGLLNTFLDAIDGSYCTYSAFGETGDNKTVDPTYPNPGYNHSLQCGVFKPTNVISLSYQLAEFNEGTSENYQKRQCNEYMKLGLQGVSVVFSSGDDGVRSRWGCIGTEKQPIFNPGFPSNCPYVTSVGATTLTGLATKDQERAVTQFPSGGGFSNYFPRPSYQTSAVEAFFKSPNAPTFPGYSGSSYGDGSYNKSGRGFPDVAAIGQAVVNFGGGEPSLAGGTSASAPVFASILNRINEERLKVGKPTVGFVNPLLYNNTQAFHDITVGNNFACHGKGFEAAVGWDPVTGLGTPNYPALLAAFMGSEYNT